MPFKVGGASSPIQLDLNENTGGRLKAGGLFGQAALSCLRLGKGIAYFGDEAEAMICADPVQCALPCIAARRLECATLGKRGDIDMRSVVFAHRAQRFTENAVRMAWRSVSLATTSWVVV